MQGMAEIKNMKHCPECGSFHIKKTQHKRQLLCKECGLIYEPLERVSEKQLEAASDAI